LNHITAIAHSILSYLSSPIPTSPLNTPSDVQHSRDFRSDRTNTPTDKVEAIDTRLDLRRIRGYEPLPHDPKLQSHVWVFGWRLIRLSNQQEYWLCRICHTTSLRPPILDNHIFKSRASTLAVVKHLKRKYSVQKEGDTPISVSSNQSSIEDHVIGLDTAIATKPTSSFDFETFKGLLLQLFILEGISFSKVEAKAFKELLTYLQPQLRDCIPSRRSLR
jgi:hypothetical protein